MTYATRADLEQRFGLAEIADLARDEDGRIETALADAAAEIDAALAALYVLPLEPVGGRVADDAPDEPAAATWPVLVHVACNLARGNLYDDRESETVTLRKRSARAKLMAIADDRTGLVDGEGRRARRRETARAEISGPAPVMTPDNLAGL